MTAEMILTVLVWLVWALIALQFALAFSAYRIERREGMAVSNQRLFTSGGILAAATVVLVVTSILPRLGGPAPAPTPEMQNAAGVDAVKVKELQAEIDANQRQIDTASNELKAAQERMAKFEETRLVLDARMRELRHESGLLNTLTDWTQTLNAASADGIILGILGILLLAAVANLLLAGPVQTVFPWLSQFAGGSKDAEKQIAALDALATLVADGNYAEALAQAKQIQDKKLPAFELLDFLFLRGFAAVQHAAFPPVPHSAEEFKALLKQAVEDLEFVIGEAPLRHEAVYTLAVAQGLAENYSAALASFEAAEAKLAADKLPFEHNKSVCLLRLAEAALSTGDTGKAEACYARVAGLPAFQGLIAHSRITIAMIELQTAVKKGDLAGASAIVTKISGFEHVDADQKQQIAVIRAALLARIALKQNDPARALAISANFLVDHLPLELPTPNDSIVDEAFSPILDADLPFARDVFVEFCFIQAVALAQLEAKNRASLTETQVATLAAPLLRGLQLLPRHRYFLGAVGGLYYWFKRDERHRAREWLEAASLQGVGGLVQSILDLDRRTAMQQREALDIFRSMSMRVLRDPAVAAEARRALAEELGRFQEFQPLLIDLQTRPEFDPEEPTIKMIRERGRYLAEVAANAARAGSSECGQQLAQIQNEYAACLSKLEQSSETLAALEKRVFGALSHVLSLA